MLSGIMFVLSEVVTFFTVLNSMELFLTSASESVFNIDFLFSFEVFIAFSEINRLCFNE